MADKLQWFKFTPADWMMGKIKKCPEVTQLRFINLCCLYWNKEGKLSIEDAIIEVDQDHYDILLSKKTIKEIDEKVCIDFLDEQLEDIQIIRVNASKAGRASAEKRKAKLNGRSTGVQRNSTEKSRVREDKSRVREDKSRVEESVPPSHFLHGKKLEETLLSDNELQMLVSKNTHYTETVIQKKIKEFCDRESLNGGKTLNNWRDYCYKSILKNYKNLNEKTNSNKSIRNR